MFTVYLLFRLAKAVKLLYSGAIFITYALSNYVICDIIWTNSIKSKITTSSKFTRISWEYVVRTAMVFVTCTYAIFYKYPVPYLSTIYLTLRRYYEYLDLAVAR